MTENKIEIVYEAIANKIDNLGEEKARLFLAKLSLLLANKIEDTSFVLNAIFEETMNFLGFTGILEALKTENYAFFKSFDGIISCVFLALPILLFVEFFIVFFREREQLRTYKVNFFIIVFNRIIGRILSLGTIVWCIGFFQEYAPFQTTYTWYWFIYGKKIFK